MTDTADQPPTQITAARASRLLTAAECQVRFPRAYADFMRLEAEPAIPGGESRGAHLARVLAWLEEVAARDRVLAVTHGGVIDFLERLALGQPLHGGEFYGGANLGLTAFEVTWPTLRFLSFSERVPTRPPT